MTSGRRQQHSATQRTACTHLSSRAWQGTLPGRAEQVLPAALRAAACCKGLIACHLGGGERAPKLLRSWRGERGTFQDSRRACGCRGQQHTAVCCTGCSVQQLSSRGRQGVLPGSAEQMLPAALCTADRCTALPAPDQLITGACPTSLLKQVAAGTTPARSRQVQRTMSLT